ncbi:hypothetical protein [Bacillus sp. RO1]|uniref:hypothetical protein n=1 Tax=Bacillus sp. RO1 TaxID=2722703 RepID=UPI0014572C08|nr:hypothetical protein [Bacillus sp. RO1]NLP49468.1 hypothetical protein [Bacillus sp. RO1]
MEVMKTSVTRKKEKRGPHGGYEDLSDEEKRRREVLMVVMKTSVTRKKEKRGSHGGYEDLSDEEKGEERFSWRL